MTVMSRIKRYVLRPILCNISRKSITPFKILQTKVTSNTNRLVLIVILNS